MARSENGQSVIRYEAVWRMRREEGLTLYPAYKRGAPASAILNVEETRRPRVGGVRNMVACISQTPLPHLLPITQENVLPGRQKARLPPL